MLGKWKLFAFNVNSGFVYKYFLTCRPNNTIYKFFKSYCHFGQKVEAWQELEAKKDTTCDFGADRT